MEWSSTEPVQRLINREACSILTLSIPTNLWIALIVLATLSLLFYLLWVVVPIVAGLPWRPTSSRRIRRAMEIARVQPGEVLFDLGSGDGRVLLMAAREYRARAVGIEISPLHCQFSRFMARVNGVADLVNIRRGDFYSADLSTADVVFAYMTSIQVARLRPHLENQLKAGARVVTISFDMDGWEPKVVDRDQLIFLYQMPPQPGNLETYLAKNL
jgi:SAM-dependent methyltransferase